MERQALKQVKKIPAELKTFFVTGRPLVITFKRRCLNYVMVDSRSCCLAGFSCLNSVCNGGRVLRKILTLK